MSIAYYIALFIFDVFVFRFRTIRVCSRMSQLGIDRYSMSMICLLICFLLQISWNLAIIMHEINEAVFLNPHTNSATIRCPLNVTRGADIRWFNAFEQRYERNRGRYYRIIGLQPFHREMICSSSALNGPGDNSDQYKFIIRAYGEKYIFFEGKFRNG
jgi:hypothetical protein